MKNSSSQVIQNSDFKNWGKQMKTMGWEKCCFKTHFKINIAF